MKITQQPIFMSTTIRKQNFKLKNTGIHGLHWLVANLTTKYNDDVMDSIFGFEIT